MTTEVNWNDGSGDKLYLTYTGTEGTQTVSVSSDAFTGYESRSRDIVFRVTAGGTTISQTLTVTQSGKDFLIITRNNVSITRNDVAIGFEQ